MIFNDLINLTRDPRRCLSLFTGEFHDIPWCDAPRFPIALPKGGQADFLSLSYEGRGELGQNVLQFDLQQLA